MSAIIILIIIVGTGLVALIFFAVRRFLRPRRVGTIARLLRGGRPQAAVRLAKQILSREPRNPDAHFLLAEAYLADGKAELALMELKIINQLGHFGVHCREIPFRRRAAELYRRFRQPEEALKEYLLLLSLEPDNPDNPFQAAQLFEERQMSEKAAQLYRRAVQVDGQHVGAHLQLGTLLYRQKRLAEAQHELEAALRLEPDNLEASFLLGRTLKAVHDFPGALRALEKAQRDPGLKVKALIEAGTCHLSMNNLAKAIPVLERAVSLSTGTEGGTDPLYARYFLALAYEKNRDLEKAIASWEAIFARNPTFRDVAQKLNQYQELRADDRMKDFLDLLLGGVPGDLPRGFGGAQAGDARRGGGPERPADDRGRGREELPRHPAAGAAGAVPAGERDDRHHDRARGARADEEGQPGARYHHHQQQLHPPGGGVRRDTADRPDQPGEAERPAAEDAREYMKILCIADHVDPLVYSGAIRARFSDAAFVLGAGDLPLEYYDFIVSMPQQAAVLRVRQPQPERDGALPAAGSGRLPAGAPRVAPGGAVYMRLSGSARPRGADRGVGREPVVQRGANQFTELQMFLRLLRLVPRLLFNRVLHGRWLDILLTHAPPRTASTTGRTPATAASSASCGSSASSGPATWSMATSTCTAATRRAGRR